MCIQSYAGVGSRTTSFDNNVRVYGEECHWQACSALRPVLFPPALLTPFPRHLLPYCVTRATTQATLSCTARSPLSTVPVAWLGRNRPFRTIQGISTDDQHTPAPSSHSAHACLPLISSLHQCPAAAAPAQAPPVAAALAFATTTAPPCPSSRPLASQVPWNPRSDEHPPPAYAAAQCHGESLPAARRHTCPPHSRGRPAAQSYTTGRATHHVPYTPRATCQTTVGSPALGKMRGHAT